MTGLHEHVHLGSRGAPRTAVHKCEGAGPGVKFEMCIHTSTSILYPQHNTLVKVALMYASCAQEAAALFQHLNRSQRRQSDLLESHSLLDSRAADRAPFSLTSISSARRTIDCAMRTAGGGTSSTASGTMRIGGGSAPSSADDLLAYLHSPRSSRAPLSVACPDGNSVEALWIPPSRNAVSPRSLSTTSLGLLRVRSRRASSTLLAKALTACAAASSREASRRNSLQCMVDGAAGGGDIGDGAVGWGLGGGVPPEAPKPAASRRNSLQPINDGRLPSAPAASRPASPTSAAQARYLRELLSCDIFDGGRVDRAYCY